MGALTTHKLKLVYSLVREPFPDPNKRRPVNMRGNMAAVPLNSAPRANVQEPRTQRKENRNTPTGSRTKHRNISASTGNIV